MLKGIIGRVNRHHPGIVTTGAGVGAAVVTTVDLFADETGSESRSVHAAKNLRMSFVVINELAVTYLNNFNITYNFDIGIFR